MQVKAETAIGNKRTGERIVPLAFL